MTITQTVEIPADRRITVPHEVPIGKAKIIIFPQDENPAEVSCVHDNCPLHTENPPFNAKALAAITEGDAIFNGEKPAKWYSSFEEAKEDLGI